MKHTRLLPVVRPAVEGVNVDEDRNRLRGRRSDRLVGEMMMPGPRRWTFVGTVTDTAGHGRATCDPDFSCAAGAGAPGAGRGRRSRSTPTPGRPRRTDSGSAVRRRRAGSTRARARSAAAPAGTRRYSQDDLRRLRRIAAPVTDG